MQVANLAFTIEDENRRMGDAAVLSSVENAITNDRLLVTVGQYLKLRSGSLSHRPGE